ncbi:hypothetical protein [Emcibacter sp.]|uniref:hypothetical protein n=1 Tax=Emcibacter sp. TaxID=1979954 RepID=UPI003A90700C
MVLAIDLEGVRGHIACMFTKKTQEPRKSLRERVADRQAGVVEDSSPASPSGIKYRKWIMRSANIFQAIGILIMLMVVMRFNDGDLQYMEELIGIAAGFFLTGRVAIIFVKNS